MNCIKIYKLYLPVIGGVFTLSFNGNFLATKETPENNINMCMSSYEDFPIIIPEHHTNKHQINLKMTVHRNNHELEKDFMNLQNVDLQNVELQNTDSLNVESEQMDNSSLFVDV